LKFLRVPELNLNFLRISPLVVHRADQLEIFNPAREDVRTGKLDGVVIIPPQNSRRVLAPALFESALQTKRGTCSARISIIATPRLIAAYAQDGCEWALISFELLDVRAGFEPATFGL
jgi:hypothetical protein